MTEIKVNSSEHIKDISKEYSIYVCENRAVPRVTDGLKDAQRKALWLLRNKADKIKTVSLAGEMISSNLYLHGDQSAAGAISMMAAPYCNNIPLLYGIGSFGTRVAPVEGIGAPRYTYVKRGKAAQELIFPDLENVPLKENYDGSTMEPITFLPIIPTVLLNGVSGIAVGWSTDILPRKFSDLVDATIAALDGKKVKNLVPTYSYLNCDVQHIEGNSWKFEGKCSITDSSTIVVTELPPDLTLEKFKDRLNTMEEEGKINTYIDRSTDNIEVTVKFARGTIKNWTEEQAVDFLKLSQKKSERIVVIGWNGHSIIQYQNAEALVKDFVEWRLTWYVKRYETMLINDNEELNFWKGVKMCFDGKLPSKLPKKKNKKEVEEEVASLTKSISLTEKQIDKIVGLPSYKWALDEYENVSAKITVLEDNIADYEAILNDDSLIKSIYKEELLALKKEKFA